MVTLNEQYLTNIANAIREKNRTSTQYTPDQMAGKIGDLLVANQVVSISDNTITQVCDNTSGTKPKDFTVTLSLRYSNTYAEVFIFSAEAFNGATITGSAAALIRRSTHAKISETISGDFGNGTASGTSINFTYNANITVPAGESRTVNIIGYALRYR